MRQTGARSFGDILHEAIEAYGMKRKIKEHELIVRWEELVGTAIANHATPKRFTHGTLWVSVDDAGWRHQLSLDRVALRDRLNATLGMPIIEEIVLR